MLPNLFIPGAAKSGTSSLYSYLSQHPEICMSETKETHFFSRDSVFSQGQDYYNTQYLDDPQIKYYGDASTSYLPSVKALTRISKMCFQPKHIVVLRDPFDRIQSHYNWLRSLNIEKRSFKEAVLESSSNFNEDRHIRGAYDNYYEFSCYGKQIQVLHDLFPAEDIHVFEFSDLIADTKAAVNSCFSFLGLENIDDVLILEKKNKTKDIREYNRALFSVYLKLPTSLKVRITNTSLFRKLSNKFGVKQDKYILNFTDINKLHEKLSLDLDLLSDFYPNIVRRWRSDL